MSKASEIQLLQTTVGSLIKELEKERAANQKLTEMCYRHEAQLARKKGTENASARWKREFSNLIFNDFREDAISIFSWEELAPTPRNFFTSKRLESQTFNFAPVCIFEHEYKFPNPGESYTTEKTLLALPFVPASPAIDCYSEFPIVRPYPPSGNNGVPDKSWILGNGNPYPPLRVNEDCVILSDFFEWSQTNANTSFCISRAVRIYADLIAECEVAKKNNRNWLKIPLIFNTDMTENDGEIRKLIAEVMSIVQAIDDNEEAIVSKYGKNLEILNTGVQYYGDELNECIKNYKNDLYNYLGIGHIKNENKARKITAEFEKTSDEYNINITKRLQLREMALKSLKEIFPQYFSKCYIKVNLDGFSPLNDDTTETTPQGTNTEGQGND